MIKNDNDDMPIMMMNMTIKMKMMKIILTIKDNVRNDYSFKNDDYKVDLNRSIFDNESLCRISNLQYYGYPRPYEGKIKKKITIRKKIRK